MREIVCVRGRESIERVCECVWVRGCVKESEKARENV